MSLLAARRTAIQLKTLVSCQSFFVATLQPLLTAQAGLLRNFVVSSNSETHYIGQFLDMANPLQDVFGQDRKQMEEERLARLAKKRSAPEIPTPEPPKKSPKLDDEFARTEPDITPAPKKASEELHVPNDTSAVTSSSDMTQSQVRTIQYPLGAIKKTWALGFERKNDIKFEEVLQKSDLKIAAISAFQWDFDWFVTKIDPRRTKCIFVMQAKNEDEKSKLREFFGGLQNVRLCLPPMRGGAFSAMHTKLMLLFYPESLRIVVPSANIVPFDWGESGVLENSVYLIDLPRLAEHHKAATNPTLTNFSTELSHFIDAIGFDDDLKQGLLNFDFSKTADVRFVHAIPGSYTREGAKGTGFPLLSKSVRSLDLRTPENLPLEVDMAASSVGALDQEQVVTMTRALRGLESKTAPPKKSMQNTLTSSLSNDIKNFRLLFPSEDTVMGSKGGERNAGTIYLSHDYYSRPTFPREIIRDYASRRPNLLSHNKMILARSPKSAFVYIGSANMSRAAWGRITHDKSTSGPKLTVANWECGVLVPVRDLQTGAEDKNVSTKKLAEEAISTASKSDGDLNAAVRKSADTGAVAGAGAASGTKSAGVGAKPSGQVLPFSVFDSILDVPFEWPAKKYETGQKPWCAK